MNLIEVVVVLIAPVGFWFAFHLYKDRHRPEPALNIIVTFLLGGLAGWLGLHAYGALELVGLRHDAYALAESSRVALFAYAILVIGPIEEIVKFLPFWLVGIRFHEFDEPVDGIIYASFAALGFATYENFLYLDYVDATEALARGFAAPLVHIMFASIWGYSCTRAQIEGRSLLLPALTGIAVAAFLHGLYDFIMIGLSAWWRPASALLILAIWIWRMHLIRRLVAYSRDAT
jgi:RsiW-degrading membrane proteinase PrsW (M82 family)